MGLKEIKITENFKPSTLYGLHGIDRQADELYESMYARLSKDERYKRTGDFMEDYRRQTEIKQLIEEEILSELVYVD